MKIFEDKKIVKGELPSSIKDKFTEFYNAAKKLKCDDVVLVELAKELDAIAIDDSIDYGLIKNMEGKLIALADEKGVYLLEKYNEADGDLEAYSVGDVSDIYYHPYNRKEEEDAVVCTECLAEMLKTDCVDGKCKVCESEFIEDKKKDEDFEGMMAIKEGEVSAQGEQLINSGMDRKEVKEQERQACLDKQIENYRKTLGESEKGDEFSVNGKNISSNEDYEVIEPFIEGQLEGLLVAMLKVCGLNPEGNWWIQEPSDDSKVFTVAEIDGNKIKRIRMVNVFSDIEKARDFAVNQFAGLKESIDESGSTVEDLWTMVTEELKTAEKNINDFSSFDDFLKFISGIYDFDNWEDGLTIYDFENEMKDVYDELKKVSPILEKKDYSQKPKLDEGKAVFRKNPDMYSPMKKLNFQDKNGKDVKVGDDIKILSMYDAPFYKEDEGMDINHTFEVTGFDPHYGTIDLMSSEDQAAFSIPMDDIEAVEVL